MMKKIIKCGYCGKTIIIKSPNNNQKFCCKSCQRKNDYYTKNLNDKRKDYKQTGLIRKYGKQNLVQCKVCGKWFRQVGSHITLTHGLTAREYREEFGFDVKRGQLPKDYRELKAELAFERGGVKNLKIGKKFWFKKGSKTAGRYKRSSETLKRLKQPSFIKKDTKK